MGLLETQPSRALTSLQQELIGAVIQFQANIRDDICRQTAIQSREALSEVVAENREGDTIFKIDALAEKHISNFAEQLSTRFPITIIAEGFGQQPFPEKTRESLYRIIIDPVDGTREIMLNKRSAWVLTGIAPDNGDETTLSDIEIAVQTEIPTTKQNIGSVVWSAKGAGAYEEEWDKNTGKIIRRKRLVSSQAQELRQGYVVFANHLPGSMEEIGKLADRVFEDLLGPVQPGRFLVFNDQYTSSGGQLYLLASGRYRFVADLRPDIEQILNKQGKHLGLGCHPYDICTALIAQEAGAIVTNAKGEELAYPLNTTTNCSFIGYSNEAIRSQMEPVLQRELSLLNGSRKPYDSEGFYIGKIADFQKRRGWFTGFFMPDEIPLLKTAQVEIAVMDLPQTDESPAHYHKIGTEVTFCLRGALRLLIGERMQEIKLGAGEFMTVAPHTPLRNPNNEPGTQIFVVKFPSIPNDKFYIG